MRLSRIDDVCLPLGTSRIRTDDDAFLPTRDLSLDIRYHGQLSEQVVAGNVEETLDLRGVEIHRDNVIRPSNGEKTGDKSCGGRGDVVCSVSIRASHELKDLLGRDRRSGLVLLVLSGIGEARDNGRNSFSGCSLACCST